MFKVKPITPAELEGIRQSAVEAVRRCSFMDKAEARLLKKALRDRSFNGGRLQAGVLLNQFRYAPRPNLSQGDVKSVIVAAADRDDKRFFIRFGKVLSRKPQQPPRRPGSIGEITMNPPPMLIQFLIGRWAEDTDECPALCRLAPAGLADVCSYVLGSEVPFDAVVKLRQRLGLKPLKRQKVQVILIGNKLKFL